MQRKSLRFARKQGFYLGPDPAKQLRFPVILQALVIDPVAQRRVAAGVFGVFEQFQVCTARKAADRVLAFMEYFQKLRNTGFREMHAHNSYQHRRF